MILPLVMLLAMTHVLVRVRVRVLQNAHHTTLFLIGRAQQPDIVREARQCQRGQNLLVLLNLNLKLRSLDRLQLLARFDFRDPCLVVEQFQQLRLNAFTETLLVAETRRRQHINTRRRKQFERMIRRLGLQMRQKQIHIFTAVNFLFLRFFLLVVILLIALLLLIECRRLNERDCDHLFDLAIWLASKVQHVVEQLGIETRCF
mmetsp:Transcript_59647/g.98450  ORF Transcript_59647/g.98450 Transcript_59647/m.98450 type:complete len:203 (+) Transcript_59647:159-767(+)